MVGRDRRRTPRRHPDPSEPLSRLRVRAGRELLVINASSSGVLVEGEARLLPGRHLDVHVMTAGGRTLVRSRVVRSFVSKLSSDRVLYRGALAFEQPVLLAASPSEPRAPSTLIERGNRVPVDTHNPPLRSGMDYPADAA